jgi:hypothetical protein
MVNSLIKHGADIEARNDYGRTPLHVIKSVEAARTLLER